MYDMCRMAQNPQAAMQSIINQNPRIKQAVELINRNGGNAKEMFYALAKSKGVNPDDILNGLR